jgi:hypothetical protein
MTNARDLRILTPAELAAGEAPRLRDAARERGLLTPSTPTETDR